MPSWIAKLPNCWRNLVEAEIVAMLSSFHMCGIGTAKECQRMNIDKQQDIKKIFYA